MHCQPSPLPDVPKLLNSLSPSLRPMPSLSIQCSRRRRGSRPAARGDVLVGIVEPSIAKLVEIEMAERSTDAAGQRSPHVSTDVSHVAGKAKVSAEIVNERCDQRLVATQQCGNHQHVGAPERRCFGQRRVVLRWRSSCSFAVEPGRSHSKSNGSGCAPFGQIALWISNLLAKVQSYASYLKNGTKSFHLKRSLRIDGAGKLVVELINVGAARDRIAGFRDLTRDFIAHDRVAVGAGRA
ncbi:hypothetical protein MESS4_330165 [Mesorhizobium sp. STM 4661]|nr:hypothetical protein MESS4_330165 [Mesorhizobium sp. STM 4661]